MQANKVNAEAIRVMKGNRGIAALTAYDYPTARLLDEAGVPLILVGDSLGMVILGYPDTTSVTLSDMEHHVQAVARAKPRALLAADLPYRTYETVEDTLRHSKRLMVAGAEAIKAEGGRQIEEQVRALVGEGIPFLGHLGMLPQRVKEEGGYRIKGRSASEQAALLADAEALVRAGAFAVVLELVVPEVAEQITRSIPIPTIGIGSGPGCDGQILVTQDLIGAYPWFVPRHVKPILQLGETVREAIRRWREGI